MTKNKIRPSKGTKALPIYFSPDMKKVSIVFALTDGEFQQQAKGNIPAGQQPSLSAQKDKPIVIQLAYPELRLLERLLQLGYDPAWKSLTSTMQAVFFGLNNHDDWQDSPNEPVDESLPRTPVAPEPEISDEDEPF
jgi:hypothetical protein